MRIRVTKRHIEDGVPGDGDACPIFHALEAIFPHDNISVKSDGVIINGRTLDLPISAREFVDRFDDDKEVEPFSFNLPVDKYVKTRTIKTVKELG